MDRVRFSGIPNPSGAGLQSLSVGAGLACLCGSVKEQGLASENDSFWRVIDLLALEQCRGNPRKAEFATAYRGLAREDCLTWDNLILQMVYARDY